MSLYANTATITAPIPKLLKVPTGGRPFQIGASGAGPLIVARNIGHARVWLGDRTMVDVTDGLPLWPGERYDHRGGDGLFACIFGPPFTLASAGAGTDIGLVAWIQYGNDAGAAPIVGAAFPWPDPLTV